MSRDDPQWRYLSSAFKTGQVDSNLKRMIGEEVDQKLQNCSQCGTQIKGGYPHDGKIYCYEHYSQFATLCAGCNQPIIGEYVNSKGKKFHKQCYSDEVRCNRCSQPIFGEVLQALDKNWHPKCFTCRRCEKALNDKFNVRKEEPFCDSCNILINKESKEAQEKNQLYTRQISQPSSDVAAKNQQIMEENRANQQAAKNIEKGKTSCASCGRIVKTNEQAVNVQGAVYHSYCFVCSSCGNSFDGSYKLKDGSPYCESCYTKKFSKLCNGCGQVLSGKFVSAFGKDFHSQCLTCCKCNDVISGPFAEQGGKPVCQSCSTKSRPAPTAVITGQRMQGFTIDPKTGEKKYR